MLAHPFAPTADFVGQSLEVGLEAAAHLRHHLHFHLPFLLGYGSFGKLYFIDGLWLWHDFFLLCFRHIVLGRPGHPVFLL